MTDRVTADAGRVLAGVLDEIALIPVERQQPQLVAAALALAAIIDAPGLQTIAPVAHAGLMAALDELHGD